MKDRVRFFSIYDMSIPHYFDRVESIVRQYQSGWRPDEVNDIVELYNIWLFVENGVESKFWNEDVLELIRSFKQDVVKFFSQASISDLYSQVVFEYRENIWEIVDRFNIKFNLTIDTLSEMLAGKTYELRYFLKQRRLVEKYGGVIAQMLRENEYAAEWLLSEYVEGEGLNIEEKLYFPASLTLADRENIISNYLDKDEPNLNYVQLVLVAKKDANLKLSDEVINPISRPNHQAIIVEDATNQLIYNTFSYGSKNLIVNRNSVDTLALNIGSDNLNENEAQLVNEDANMTVINSLRFNGHSYDNKNGELKLYNRITMDEPDEKLEEVFNC